MDKEHNPTPENAKLAYQVFDAVYAGFESFREDNVGADLAYLMGAILEGEDSFVDWSPEVMEERPAILRILLQKFPDSSPLWGFIRL